MADIKKRKVDRTSIKKVDHSIAASQRIRDAASEIRRAGRAGEQSGEESVTEYATQRLQEGMQRGRYAAEKGITDTGSASARAVRRALKDRFIKQRGKTYKNGTFGQDGLRRGESSKMKSGAAAEAGVRRNRAKEKAKAAERSRKAMMDAYRKSGKIIRKSGTAAVRTAKAAARAARFLAESVKALVSAIAAGGTAAVVVVVCCILFGAAFYFFGDESSDSYIPVSPEVEAYTPVIEKYCKEYGIPQYVELVKAVMMQESGGKGLDPMQASECGYNTRYPKEPNTIKDPEYSISCGVHYLSDNLSAAKAKSPVDMDRIKLALQGYNFGSGYIPWAISKYGGYSYAGAVEFSKDQAKKHGWSSYGNPEYVQHVLRYYPYGNYSYDVITTGPGKLGLPIQGMTKGNISSHFGPRSSPGGIGSKNHKGLDIAFPAGTKVYACESGTVTTAGWVSGFGKCIIINHGGGLQTVYGHLSDIKVKSGQKVVRGQYIGNVGSTGNSTGPHLHLGVMLNGNYVNPEKGWLSVP